MNPVTGLSLGRIAIGAVSLGNPELAGKLFRLDVRGNPQLPYLSRMFGAREIAIGAVTLLATGTAWRNLVLAGMAVDAADAFAGYRAGQDGYVPRATSGMLVAPAVAAVVAGAVGLRTR